MGGGGEEGNGAGGGVVWEDVSFLAGKCIGLCILFFESFFLLAGSGLETGIQGGRDLLDVG